MSAIHYPARGERDALADVRRRPATCAADSARPARCVTPLAQRSPPAATTTAT